jgi:N-glycosylase/DNA lyase
MIEKHYGLQVEQVLTSAGRVVRGAMLNQLISMHPLQEGEENADLFSSQLDQKRVEN